MMNTPYFKMNVYSYFLEAFIRISNIIGKITSTVTAIGIRYVNSASK